LPKASSGEKVHGVHRRLSVMPAFSRGSPSKPVACPITTARLVPVHFRMTIGCFLRMQWTLNDPRRNHRRAWTNAGSIAKNKSDLNVVSHMVPLRNTAVEKRSEKGPVNSPIAQFCGTGSSSSNVCEPSFEEGAPGYAPYIFLRKIHMDRLYEVG